MRSGLFSGEVLEQSASSAKRFTLPVREGVHRSFRTGRLFHYVLALQNSCHEDEVGRRGCKEFERGPVVISRSFHQPIQPGLVVSDSAPVCWKSSFPWKLLLPLLKRRKVRYNVD